MIALIQVDNAWSVLAAQATIAAVLTGGLLWVATLFIDSRLTKALDRLIERLEIKFVSQDTFNGVKERVDRIEKKVIVKEVGI